MCSAMTQNNEWRDFVARLSPGARLLGVDAGEKTLGLALSDLSRTVATPYETLVRGQWKKDAARLKAIIDKERVGGLVVGWPRNMDGSEGPRCQSSRQFARNCEAAFGLPWLLWDERLSTSAVTRMMVEADMSRKRRAELVDKLAAAYILQGALDALHGSEV